MRTKKIKKIIVPPEPILLTTVELATFLNISDKTVQKWKKEGMPVAINHQNVLRFDRRACLTWLAENNNDAT
ncbi:MAG: helix-turn-helix domain-containing protein [Thermoguttaceae bacterium]|nr:helix-turn-helix domain-containing protein [Thermoguttaceae bacterium]